MREECAPSQAKCKTEAFCDLNELKRLKFQQLNYHWQTFCGKLVVRKGGGGGDFPRPIPLTLPPVDTQTPEL